MTTIHREGWSTIGLVAAVLVIVNGVLWGFGFDLFNGYVGKAVFVLSAIVLILVVQFFRSPRRAWTQGEELVIAPADGKVVVIEETHETEFFNDRRLQISIFMSPLNVHVNRHPVSGRVIYSRYHPGKYLVAWHPKSSTENERTTTVVETPGHHRVLFRQIAGALAKRIVNRLEEGQQAQQAAEFGFIKFGSRVDVFLPIGTPVDVVLGQKTKGGVTTIARMLPGVGEE